MNSTDTKLINTYLAKNTITIIPTHGVPFTESPLYISDTNEQYLGEYSEKLEEIPRAYARAHAVVIQTKAYARVMSDTPCKSKEYLEDLAIVLGNKHQHQKEYYPTKEVKELKDIELTNYLDLLQKALLDQSYFLEFKELTKNTLATFCNGDVYKVIVAVSERGGFNSQILRKPKPSNILGLHLYDTVMEACELMD
jgi:hypothetical protein